MSLRRSAGFACVVLVAAAACGGCGARPGRPAEVVDVPGLPALSRVDDGVWRSAQPSAEGLRRAHVDLGVRTVVNLRSFHSDRDLVAGAGLDLVEIPMVAWHADDDQIVAALRVLVDPARRPVLVHCQHGVDRTGLVIGAYRRVVQGWSADAARQERREQGAAELWADLDRWLRDVDVAAVRARVYAPR
jgi:protein tyrosine phosphatase (PTP) superfamily phosphohydrolase (DUF442 family)